MANKTFCDGCNTDLTPKLERYAGGVIKYTVPIGELGDGIQRQVDLRIGTMTIRVDSCPTCMNNALEVLSSVFKAPVAELVQAIGRAKASTVAKVAE